MDYIFYLWVLQYSAGLWKWQWYYIIIIIIVIIILILYEFTVCGVDVRVLAAVFVVAIVNVCAHNKVGALVVRQQPPLPPPPVI